MDRQTEGQTYSSNYNIDSTKMRTSGICTSGDRTSGGPPVLDFNKYYSISYSSVGANFRGQRIQYDSIFFLPTFFL